MTAGKVIGDVVQYRLDTSIASGAFSTVWRCSELSSGRTYAVKIVEKKAALRNKMTGALIREVNALEIAGSSPYVTRLVDKMVSKHNYYLVMDLAEGGTLLDIIRERRQELRQLQVSSSSGCSVMDSLQLSAMLFMPYDRVRYYFKQLLLALSALHDRNIVHRDVKPENILLNKHRTRLLLSDFGFACHSMLGAQLHRACGTLKYCAPELLHEHPSYDGRKVDVWAAGITLYMMLFGGYPYRCSRGDPDAFLEVIETTTYRIPRPIPALIEDILQHMLCIDSAQRWSVKQLLQHPWITGLELRSPSASPATSVIALSAEVLVPPAVSVPDTEGAITEMPSEDCPPVDSLPSDEDDVDDGFYQSINHDQLSSSVSSGLNGSTISTHQSRERSSLSESRRLHREAFPLAVSPASPLHCGDPAVVQGGEPETPGASKALGLQPPTGNSRTCAKEEILKYGIEFTSLTSIESFVASGDEGETDDSEDEGRFWEEMREGSATRDHLGNATMSSSLYTRASDASDAQQSGLRGLCSYGLWLTARMAAYLVSFIAVHVVAVALRVFLKRDIIDLPLPEGIRDYISFLYTPLHRPHAHLSGAAPRLRHSRGGSSTASALALRQKGSHGDSSARGRQVELPIPGSGLRHYVRSAGRLMQGSFMGSAVLSPNAPLVDFAHCKTPVPCPRKHSKDHSLSSTPGASSLATVAPTQSSAKRQSMESGEATTAEAYAENVELPAFPPLNLTKRWENTIRVVSPADGNEQRGRQESDSSLRKELRSTRPPPPPLISVGDPISAMTAAVASLRTLTSAKTPVRNEAQVDSQEGVTDDTGSCDSALDKSACLLYQNIMFSPLDLIPMALGDHQHEMETFPAAATTGHA
ncbi:phosphorylase kinase-like protein [Leishmania mexicana MHOM/GT/2001/U1103]|uniref:Protein kinase domain-containing protein n=1 Tax=Leishmania mexicana (strain MHOM/GT/2001/U1103) TaxID=929439 RepID=E9B020_LEIMU|nr:phosphorylase kinase-like protein [Leishmania mexicana MHOM/GT/2001/U1103]CBZ28571.1 phosphorylase kinase-like protein [Leishmania mexicana MHOM/GT/2001/U1103]